MWEAEAFGITSQQHRGFTATTFQRLQTSSFHISYTFFLVHSAESQLNYPGGHNSTKNLSSNTRAVSYRRHILYVKNTDNGDKGGSKATVMEGAMLLEPA